MDVPTMAREERADLVEFLNGLSPEQWERPSLCAGWRVRDVVAHVIGYEELGIGGVASRMARAGFRPHRMNVRRAAELAGHTPDDLVATLRRNPGPRGLGAGFGGRICLADSMIHHQDIRRPLGAPRTVPAERLVPTLEFARWVPPLWPYARLRGLRLEATDVDWAHGRGPVVRGPGEALLMAIAGRRGAAGELTGPGQPTLAARIDA